MTSLSDTISGNVRVALRNAGSPSLYRVSREMIEKMVRPPGIGRDKHGDGANPETARRHIEDCFSRRKYWRVDYVEAIAKVLGVAVADLVVLPREK